MPMRFPGPPEERKANHLSHNFIPDGEECPRCAECDCRAGGIVAEWPCGAEVPRTDQLMSFDMSGQA